MNTIDGLKQLPSIIKNLLDQRDAIQLQINECYKPFRDIIVEVFLHSKEWGNSLYIDDLDIGIDENHVCFCIRWRNDDECESTHSFPIEAFVSADALRNHIAKGTL